MPITVPSRMHAPATSVQKRAVSAYGSRPLAAGRIAPCSVQRDVQPPMSWQYQRTSGQLAPPSATMAETAWYVPHSQHDTRPSAGSRRSLAAPPGLRAKGTAASLTVPIIRILP